MSWQDLPLEIWFKLLDYLDSRAVCTVSLIFNQARHAATNNLLWKKLLLQEFANQNNEAILTHLGCALDWKFVYKIMYHIKRRIRPNFWDDGMHFKDTREVLVSPGKHYLSVIVKQAVATFLKARKQDIWSPTLEQVEILAIALAAEPKIQIMDFVCCLLEVARGPLKTEPSRFEYRLDSSTMARFEQNISEVEQNSSSDDAVRVLALERIMEHVNNQEHEQYSARNVFRSSRRQVQTAVLRIILTLAQVCRWDSVERTTISARLRSLLIRRVWTQESNALICWIRRLLRTTHSLPEVSRRDISETLDFSTQPCIAAARLTHYDQHTLSRYYLDDYLQYFLRDAPSEPINIYGGIFYGNDRKLECTAISQVWEELTLFTSMIVDYFHDPKAIRAKQSSAIAWLVDVAETLYKLSNYATLKAVLSAIRGVLSTPERSQLSWKDFDYSILKTFVRLESCVASNNDYQVYKDALRRTDKHCIPILEVHAREIECIRKDRPVLSSSSILGSTSSRRSQAVKRYQVFKNKAVATEVARLYYTFTRR